MKTPHTHIYPRAPHTVVGAVAGVGGGVGCGGICGRASRCIFFIFSLYNYYLADPNENHTMGLASRIWLKKIYNDIGQLAQPKTIYNGIGQLAQPKTNYTMTQPSRPSTRISTKIDWTLRFPFAGNPRKNIQ